MIWGKLVKLAERFNALRYVSNSPPSNIPGRIISVGKDPLVTGDNVEKVLAEKGKQQELWICQKMERWRGCCSGEAFKSTQMRQDLKIPLGWKNANPILIHKKRL